MAKPRVIKACFEENAKLDIRAKLKVVIGAVLIGAFGMLSYEIFYWFTHVYENNARVQTDLTNISAQVDGKIEDILVEEGSTVKAGQLLISLVQDDIKLNIESLRTDLALEKARRASLVSEKEAFEVDLQSKLETQREKIHSLELEHRSIRDRLELAQKNLSRVKFLFDKKLTPEAQFTDEQDKALVLQGKTSFLAGNIAVAKKEFNQLMAARKQIEVRENKIKISDIKQNQIGDMIRKQKLSLSYRLITSPIDGVVGRIHKFKGEYIEDGVNILMLHDPTRYWIEAYVDESQIRHVRVGQDVLINFDAYPFEDYFGKVRRIGNITTAEMGAGNRTAGNGKFGGSIERVPVRISLDNPPPNLTPGMRADINVRIYDSIRLW